MTVKFSSEDMQHRASSNIQYIQSESIKSIVYRVYSTDYSGTKIRVNFGLMVMKTRVIQNSWFQHNLWLSKIIMLLILRAPESVIHFSVIFIAMICFQTTVFALRHQNPRLA